MKLCAVKLEHASDTIDCSDSCWKTSRVTAVYSEQSRIMEIENKTGQDDIFRNTMF